MPPARGRCAAPPKHSSRAAGAARGRRARIHAARRHGSLVAFACGAHGPRAGGLRRRCASWGVTDRWPSLLEGHQRGVALSTSRASPRGAPAVGVAPSAYRASRSAPPSSRAGGSSWRCRDTSRRMLARAQTSHRQACVGFARLELCLPDGGGSSRGRQIAMGGCSTGRLAVALLRVVIRPTWLMCAFMSESRGFHTLSCVSSFGVFERCCVREASS